MTTLDEVAAAVKSANAGASMMTFDVVFADETSYEETLASGAITPESVAGLYRIDPAGVAVHACAPVLTIKITIPRRSANGGPDETDFDGVQQFAPLLDLPVPPLA